MPPSASVRAHIHENFFSYSPSVPDQNQDIVVQALDEAIDAIWDWVSNNLISLNNGLPQPFRTRATTDMKFLLLALMASERTGGLLTVNPKVEEDG